MRGEDLAEGLQLGLLDADLIQALLDGVSHLVGLEQGQGGLHGEAPRVQLHEPMLRRYQPGRRIVLLHAFVKRTEAIRQSDLDVARTRKPAG